MTQTPAQRLSESIRAVRRERVAMVAFMTAGFPSKDRFRADLEALAAQADVVEIGVPFTDPMADGVTIQRSSLAALAQGVSLAWIIETLKAMPRLPAQLVFMGYLNP
ncbi:MAG TPA: tryptophan synthase subunit alpha, partial [Steroidobacteraceae bacterium]|nr:tryptophan synthase subunit alpha [Steroidobacteraceae bacterium]